MFITIAMTGLDQEMMQKNLSVATVGGAQEEHAHLQRDPTRCQHACSYCSVRCSISMPVQHGIELPQRRTMCSPRLALAALPAWLGLFFIIGLISALFPSADGALTALTASTCIDLIGIQGPRLG
jgi:hypothetical protein